AFPVVFDLETHCDYQAPHQRPADEFSDADSGDRHRRYRRLHLAARLRTLDAAARARYVPGGRHLDLRRLSPFLLAQELRGGAAGPDLLRDFRRDGGTELDSLVVVEPSHASPVRRSR